MPFPDDSDPSSGADTIEETVRVGDPDRWLGSRLIADPAARADVVTLLAYDLELARAPRRASNPLIGEIRLTWWREALDEVFGGAVVRRHPTAQALAELVGRRGLAREAFEGLIDARYVELDKRPLTSAEAVIWADGTAGEVARLTALILDPAADGAAAAAAGRAWGLSRAVRIDLVIGAAARPLIATALAEHRRARPLPVAAFPAAAVGALARGGGEMTDVEKRLRLLWAAIRGRA